MTLQDDIARYATGNRVLNTYDGSEPIIQSIAAGLERDYYLVKLADLPAVEEDSGTSAADYQRLAHRYLALFLHKQACESEAAVLARRRDAVARELGKGGYKELYGGDPALRTAIDRIVELAEKLEAQP